MKLKKRHLITGVILLPNKSGEYSHMIQYYVSIDYSNIICLFSGLNTEIASAQY